MDGFGERQQALLGLLLKVKQGLTIDQLALHLKITRTAVWQHIAALEKPGYLEKGEIFSTGGRPGQAYRLTQKGYNLFPKQYSWFSEVLLEAVRKEKGPKALGTLLAQLGRATAASMKKRFENKNLSDRVQETVAVMNELAYQAEADLPKRPGIAPAIEATNCVFHALAQKYPEVCKFDLALLSKVTGSKVIDEKCIAQGENVCRFRFESKKTSRPQ
jgi:DeoR family transcriptional regulator, suf operon transcriptional repressor